MPTPEQEFEGKEPPKKKSKLHKSKEDDAVEEEQDMAIANVPKVSLLICPYAVSRQCFVPPCEALSWDGLWQIDTVTKCNSLDPW
jgi:hypothetical protein